METCSKSSVSLFSFKFLKMKDSVACRYFCKPKFKSAVKSEKHVLISLIKDRLHWANWDTFGNMRWQQLLSMLPVPGRGLYRDPWHAEAGLRAAQYWSAVTVEWRTKWVMMSGKGPKGWTAPRQLAPPLLSLVTCDSWSEAAVQYNVDPSSIRTLTRGHPNLAFVDFSWWSQAQVHIFMNQEFHLICHVFVWSDLRYPHATTETIGSGGFIRKWVEMWISPWENKSEPQIPVCNIILSQTSLFLNIGTSLFKRVVVFTFCCTFSYFIVLMTRTCPRAGKHLNPDSVIMPADGGSAAIHRDSSISLSD